jgi:2-keto-4-pentenoate hydratase/2-oxohepta-3-ene-1,7-dioic acid hydratase in catechol pathway
MIEQYTRIRCQGGEIRRCLRRGRSPIEGSLGEDIADGASYYELEDPDDPTTSWIGGEPPAQSDPMSAGQMVGFAAPTAPSKIVCVGRNYRSHAEELGNAIPEEPLIFLKPPSALVGSGDAIEIPLDAEDVQHEAELALVIGTRCRHVDADRADQVVAGVTAANDVTARDLQRRDKLFTRGKGFDTFCPLGPAITPVEDWASSSAGEVEWHTIGSDETAGVRAEVDGELRQQGVFSDFIFSVGEVIAYISRIMTLEPGDVVLTGTPSGVGSLVNGNDVSVTVDGVGRLTNHVRGGENHAVQTL